MKVGEMFQFGRIKLKCILETGCKDCFFYRFGYSDDIFITKNITGPCSKMGERIKMV